MSSSSPEVVALPLAPGVALSLRWPEHAREEPASGLPAVDLSAIAGARVALRRGVEGPDGLRVRALCAAAPSDRWAPGAEELVLDRATALARSGAPGEVTRWEAAPIRVLAGAPGGFEQRFEGIAREGEAALAVRGRHLLGFAGEDREALLCSVLCAEPAAGAAELTRCAAMVSEAALEGALQPAPAPGLMVRGILLAAEHPRPAAGIVAVVAAMGIALMLARRPRRPW